MQCKVRVLIFKEKVIIGRILVLPLQKRNLKFIFHSFLKFIPVGQKNCFTKRLKEKTKIQKKSMYGILN